jgi:macrolide transport system ATP-binding/permease protein
VGTFWQDFRYAVRMLAKKPAFTAVAILSLTLGIGANTTIFTLVKAVFLQSVPIKDPSRVVVIFSTQQSKGSTALQFLPLSRPNAEDYREMNNVFSASTVIIQTGSTLTISGKDIALNNVALVTGEFFDLVGVQPKPGRGFLPDEDKTPGAKPVVVLSAALWKTQFGEDPNILGRTVLIGGTDYSVIGIAPANFHDLGTMGSPDVYIPMMMHDQVLTGVVKGWYDLRGARTSLMLARLKPGVSLSAARESLHALGTQLEKTYPKDNAGRNNDMLPMNQTFIPPNQRALFAKAGGLMMIVVGLVLLIACANVANLLLTRATQRRRELAIRLSMGASRWRLIRQLLTESLLLSVISGVLGIALAYFTKDLIWKLVPAGGADPDRSMDVRVLLFTMGLAIVASVIFGLIPALQASKTEQMAALRDRSDAPSGSSRWYGVRGILVMTQVAFSLIALVGAGIFIHSLRNAQQMDPGFEVKHELVMNINLAAQNYPQAHGEQFYRDVQEKISALPMVVSASIADVPPFNSNFQRTTFPQGVDQADPRNGKLTPTVSVTPGYFGTTGISLLNGREFTDHDDMQSQFVAVVNQALVDTMFAGQNPIGKHLHFLLQTWDVEIVGVAKTVKFQSLNEPPQPLVYFPMKQHYGPGVTIYVRTKGDPGAAKTSVLGVFKDLDPTLPVTRVLTGPETVDRVLAQAQLGAELLAGFGLLALLLAAIGTYGVMSYSVSQRTQEIGIRMALGAQRGDVLKLILGSGMAMVFGGVIAGLFLSYFLTSAVEDLLFGISAFDVPAFAATAGLLILIALVACWLPARRAMRVDPMIALRYE